MVKYRKDSNGRWRDASGHYVKTATVERWRKKRRALRTSPGPRLPAPRPPSKGKQEGGRKSAKPKPRPKAVKAPPKAVKAPPKAVKAKPRPKPVKAPPKAVKAKPRPKPVKAPPKAVKAPPKAVKAKPRPKPIKAPPKAVKAPPKPAKRPAKRPALRAIPGRDGITARHPRGFPINTPPENMSSDEVGAYLLFVQRQWELKNLPGIEPTDLSPQKPTKRPKRKRYVSPKAPRDPLGKFRPIKRERYVNAAQASAYHRIEAFLSLLSPNATIEANRDGTIDGQVIVVGPLDEIMPMIEDTLYSAPPDTWVEIGGTYKLEGEWRELAKRYPRFPVNQSAAYPQPASRIAENIETATMIDEHMAEHGHTGLTTVINIYWNPTNSQPNRRFGG